MLIAAAYSRALRTAAQKSSERNSQNQPTSAATKQPSQSAPSASKSQH